MPVIPGKEEQEREKKRNEKAIEVLKDHVQKEIQEIKKSLQKLSPAALYAGRSGNEAWEKKWELDARRAYLLLVVKEKYDSWRSFPLKSLPGLRQRLSSHGLIDGSGIFPDDIPNDVKCHIQALSATTKELQDKDTQRKETYKNGPGAASAEAGEWNAKAAKKVLDDNCGGIAGYDALPHGQKKPICEKIGEAIKAKDERNVYNILNKLRKKQKKN